MFFELLDNVRTFMTSLTLVNQKSDSKISISYIPIEQKFYVDQYLLRTHSLKINIFGDI